MRSVLYYLLLIVVYPVASLPFRILYFLSDVMYVIVYRLIGYRKTIVMTNLKNSFPEKSDQALLVIQQNFYRHFCDLIVETMKTLTITEKQIRKRIDFDPTGDFSKHFDRGESIIIAMGHFGNWELAGAAYAVAPIHKLYVIYHPVKQPQFDRLIYRMRTRLGNGLYPMAKAIKGMIGNRSALTATAFIADQSPHPDHAHWMTFLNQDTAVFTGLAKIGRKLNYPIVYVSMRRRSGRGRHTVYAETLFQSPKEHSEQEIIEAYMRRLETDILENPSHWLWSHRRWKHQRNGTAEQP